MIISILEEYIPTEVLSDLQELEDEDKEASMERRTKWSAQVRETVNLLHEIGSYRGMESRIMSLFIRKRMMLR